MPLVTGPPNRGGDWRGFITLLSVIVGAVLLLALLSGCSVSLCPVCDALEQGFVYDTATGVVTVVLEE